MLLEVSYLSRRNTVESHESRNAATANLAETQATGPIGGHKERHHATV